MTVAVAGGGPAGSVAALALARAGFAVVVLEASRYEAPRPGETLPPAARPVLHRLGIVADVDAVAVPSYGNESAWGDAEVRAAPFVAHPYGPGWHVDRRAFDALLAERAAAAGATVRRGVRVVGCAASGDGWRLTLDDGSSVEAAGVVDATGRTASLARHLGARPDVLDALVGVVARYRGPASPGGATLVEASEGGWHYSAPLPGGEAVVTFITDADLWAARRGPGAWDAALAGAPATAARVAGLLPTGSPEVVSASSRRLVRTDEAPWVAVGDAALAVDPLASSGLTTALVTGEAGALALAHRLLGRPEPLREYERRLDEQWRRYQVERAASYGRERRWPDAAFWSRRAAAVPVG